MSKDRSFAAKLAKAAHKGADATCPVCGEPTSPVLFVVSEKSPVTNAWRFNKRLVKVCKCNQKEIYG